MTVLRGALAAVVVAVVAWVGSAHAAGWVDYVNLEMKDTNLKAGGLFGADGSTWAASGVTMTNVEAKAVYAAMGKGAAGCAGGFTVGGAKYLFTRFDAASDTHSGVAVAKKGSATLFVVLSKAKKGFIVGVTKDGANPGAVTGHLNAAASLAKAGF